MNNYNKYYYNLIREEINKKYINEEILQILDKYVEEEVKSDITKNNFDTYEIF